MKSMKLSKGFLFLYVLSALLVFAGVYLVTTSKSRAQMETEKNGHPRANR